MTTFTLPTQQPLGNDEGFDRGERLSGHLHDTRCLILDVELPRMSGLDLQGYLAAAGRRIPIIVVSGIDHDGMQERALRAGAVDFLHKPPNPEALLEAVRSALKLA